MVTKRAHTAPAQTGSGGQAIGALADPMRQAIVRLLAVRPAAVHEIAAAMPVSRPAISKHLRVLVASGLVECQRQGTRNVYALRAEGMNAARDWIDEVWTLALRRFQLLAENTAPATAGRRRQGRPSTPRATTSDATKAEDNP